MSESDAPQRLQWSTGGASGDMSQASITAAVKKSGRQQLGIQLQWTGTPTGTFSFRVSQVHDPSVPANTKWTVVDSSLFSPALVNPAGSASDTGVVFPNLPFEWIQVTYTRTGSSGTLVGDVKAL